jgi:hypothetical protein
VAQIGRSVWGNRIQSVGTTRDAFPRSVDAKTVVQWRTLWISPRQRGADDWRQRGIGADAADVRSVSAQHQAELAERADHVRNVLRNAGFEANEEEVMRVARAWRVWSTGLASLRARLRAVEETRHP